MTTMKVLSTALALALVACSSNEPAVEPAPAAAAVANVDPVGMYDFQATFGGQSRTGTLEITRSDTGGLRGEAWLEGEADPAIIESGAVTGNHVSLFGFVEGNQISFELDFSGATYTGIITEGGDTVIQTTGTRR